MQQARTLMIQGTASTVGKSTLVTGLCRLFAQEGLRVAPFKAQNMSLNAAVTPDGKEISRAQATQAEAAGIIPTVEMNPILLKPESQSRSQVIMMGKPLAALEAREYYRRRSGFAEIVEQALAKLRQEYDLVIIEGAGSPVELNLKHYDLVNMRVAQIADAPVLLTGDIDRGGIFAALLGTLSLLQPEERTRVKGLIVNKFRGDLALWQEGERMLAEMGGVPVLGTIPYVTGLQIAEEDAVALDEGTAYLHQQHHQGQGSALDIVLIRLPYMSNFDEFDALAADPMVRLHIVARPEELPEQPDLIILPGSKNTLADLDWLWRRGLAQSIRTLAHNGCAVLGICGGYQLLGERLSDPSGVEAEAGTVEPGLGLLPTITTFATTSDKLTRLTHVQIASAARRGLFAHLPTNHNFQAYQIRLGRTVVIEETLSSGNHAFYTANQQQDREDSGGWLNADGWCAGCYLHGLFENAAFKQGIFAALAERRSLSLSANEQPLFTREQAYNQLADVLRQHLDLPTLYEICQLQR